MQRLLRQSKRDLAYEHLGLYLSVVLAPASPLDQAFHALADPSRRAMIDRLARGPASVSELATPLSMSLPAVMQHLAVLEASGLVRSAKVGRVRTCSIDPTALAQIEQWAGERRAEWQRSIDRLGQMLAETETNED